MDFAIIAAMASAVAVFLSYGSIGPAVILGIAMAFCIACLIVRLRRKRRRPNVG